MGCHSLLQGIFLDPGIEPRSPALQVDSLLSEPPGKPLKSHSVSWQITTEGARVTLQGRDVGSAIFTKWAKSPSPQFKQAWASWCNAPKRTQYFLLFLPKAEPKSSYEEIADKSNRETVYKLYGLYFSIQCQDRTSLVVRWIRIHQRTWVQSLV